MSSRVVTVRLPQDQLAALETVASFDGVALAEELREGVQLLLEARRSDPKFHARVRESFEQARQILEGIEGGQPVIDALRPAAEAAAAALAAIGDGDEATAGSTAAASARGEIAADQRVVSV